MPIVITKEQLCDMLGVTDRTIDNWVADGRLPAPKRPTQRTVFWLGQDIDQWLQSLGSDPMPTPPLGAMSTRPGGFSEL